MRRVIGFGLLFLAVISAGACASTSVPKTDRCGPPTGCFCRDDGVWIGRDGKPSTIGIGDGEQMVRCVKEE